MIEQARRILSVPYALIGILMLSAAVLGVILQVQRIVIPQEWQFTWRVTTGSLLLGTITYQWWLMRRRWIGKMTRTDYVAHRWTGVLATFLFALHAVRIGHTWMTAVTVVFCLIALTGILNKEVLRFRTRGAYLVWFGLHVSLSAVFVPLILTHIWIALVY